MANIDFATITDPISDDAPCGPDLDMEFDDDFMNFMAGIEGVLPTSYFSFEPSTIDFNNYYEQIAGFLERTRDVRLFVPLAKLYILQGNLTGFADALDGLHRVLKEHWMDVHPQPMDGDYELRMAYLYPLDDMPNSVLPFQHAALFRSRRSGPITLRKWQLAKGEVNTREGEDAIDEGEISQAFRDEDDATIASAREQVIRVRDALSGIRLVCIEEAGFDSAVVLERLPKAVESLVEMIDENAGTGVVGAGEGEEDLGSPVATDSARGSATVHLPTGAVKNREDAHEALYAAARYFALKEPASPVPVLLREAQAAGSKGFYELVSEMLPDAAGGAALSLGKDPFFELNLYTLDARNPAPDYESDTSPYTEASSSWETAGLEEEVVSENDLPASTGNDDVSTSGNDAASETADDATANDTTTTDAVANDTAANDQAANDEVGATEYDTAPETANDTVAEPEIANDAATDEGAGNDESVEAGPRFVANSRPEATALMDMVLDYYKVAEPSSPVSLLLERAIQMAEMSFMDILDQILPEGTLKTIPRPGEEGGEW